LIGTALADLEVQKPGDLRFLRYIRNWPWYAAIFRDLGLLAIITLYGSFEIDRFSGYMKCEGNCDFHSAITYSFSMPYVASCWIYAINFIILALVSPAVKIVFSSGFFQFLGKISYSLFLV
jgi:hypothetical protein